MGTTTGRRRAGGFSLIETMIVVAIIMILAALAVPQLLPQVHMAHLDGAAEATAAFLARARNEAMLSKRCVRVWVDTTDPRRMVSEKLNTFDCDTSPATFPPGFGSVGLDGVNRVWSPLGQVRIEAKSGTLALVDAPADTSACSTQTGSTAGTPAGFPCAHVIFRPNGRTWTVNPDPNDDAVFAVAHAGLGPSQAKNVLVNSNGHICIAKRGEALPNGAGAGDFTCP